MASLALCEEVVGMSAALRAALYARAQALQLLKTSLACEPVDRGLFTTEGALPTPAGVPDAGKGRFAFLHSSARCAQCQAAFAL